MGKEITRCLMALAALATSVAKAGIVTGVIIGSMLSHDHDNQQPVSVTVTDNKSVICLYNIETDKCSNAGMDNPWLSIMQLIARQEGGPVHVQVLSKTYMRDPSMGSAYVYVIVEYKVIR